ncbi:hypothetical protein E4634_17820 [Mangrovimicrobium sediminis]|uniref:Uncharacterized protein n=1 Tax=Mangrovimicrobium sediminis TaxID=2562682 RepID=A0A4Z0LW14_9GAMM|nr:hypothetical protein [Haliea sp. SAOS-164]TGD71512.1 hypothetical protein E4634_17820 [Haliea sp. SAOS-164]
MGLGIAAKLLQSPNEDPALVAAPAAPAPPPGAESPRAPAPPAIAALSTPPDPNLLQQPAVQRYLARQARSERLHAWFADPAGAGISAGEAWQLIEELEREQAVLGVQALALKLAWLREQEADPERFAARAEALREEYAQRAAASEAQRAPTNTPAYADYKTREAAILAEAKQRSFSSEAQRSAWLREQLQAAREQAYGQSPQ